MAVPGRKGIPCCGSRTFCPLRRPAPSTPSTPSTRSIPALRCRYAASARADRMSWIGKYIRTTFKFMDGYFPPAPSRPSSADSPAGSSGISKAGSSPITPAASIASTRTPAPWPPAKSAGSQIPGPAGSSPACHRPQRLTHKALMTEPRTPAKTKWSSRSPARPTWKWFTTWPARPSANCWPNSPPRRGKNSRPAWRRPRPTRCLLGT